MYLGTNFMPPVIHPTQQIVNHTFSTTVVPHIHPIILTTVNHHMYQHKHYCPHTASCVRSAAISKLIVVMCPGVMPCSTCANVYQCHRMLPGAQAMRGQICYQVCPKYGTRNRYWTRRTRIWTRRPRIGTRGQVGTRTIHGS